MAKKKVAAKSFDLSAAFKNAGIAVSAIKTKLWSEPELVVENLPKEEFQLFVSTKFTPKSSYVLVRTDSGSRLIGFAPGEVEKLIESWDFDAETGEVLEHDLTISLGVVTALRDDKDLDSVRDLDNEKVPVTKGVQTVRAYVD